LSWTGVTDAGLKELAGLKDLRKLDLRATEVRSGLPEMQWPGCRIYYGWPECNSDKVGASMPQRGQPTRPAGGPPGPAQQAALRSFSRAATHRTASSHPRA